MSLSNLGLAAAAWASILGAQTPFYIAYPQDSTFTGGANPLPMGYNKSAPHDEEARYQQLIPNRFLPSTGANISALGFMVAAGSPVTYQWLRVRISHLASDTLARDFATNLPNPIVVLDQRGFSIPWKSREWTVIGLATPIHYDGVSNLVFDFQKVLDSTQQVDTLTVHGLSSDASGLSLGRPTHRTDLPVAWQAFGRLGSGAALSPTGHSSGVTVLKIRFYVDVPTVVLRSDPNRARRIFAPGSCMDVSNRAPPGAIYGNLVDVTFGAPLQFPNILGTSWLWLPNVVVLNGGTIPASGTTTLSLRIPNDPGLIRDHFVLQGVTASPMLTNLRWTNATDFYVNPLN